MNKMTLPDGEDSSIVSQVHNSSLQNIIVEMCLNLFDKIDQKNGEGSPLPVSKSSLNRGINGQRLDDKTIRTIACLYYKTENFNTLLNLVPDCLKETIDRANNKLSHQGNVPIEIATNSELIKLWNLCLGEGCSKALGESYFSSKFDELINVLIEYKLIAKSLFKENTWIACGEMIANREDIVLHYETMHDFLKPSLQNKDLSKFIQFGSRMSIESYERLMIHMMDFLDIEVRKEALRDLESDCQRIKFNFQMSLVPITGDNDETH